MIYGFDTEIEQRATAAQIIYAVYKSRSIDRFKVSVKMWEQITNFSKLAAKKSTNLAEFIEKLRKSMCCEVIHPRYCSIDKGEAKSDGQLVVEFEDGTTFESGEDRQFMTSLIEHVDEKRVISCVINETAFIIMLVRERLENEKIIETKEDK